MEYWELVQKRSLPLEAKIALSESRIREFYDRMGGNVYVSFSGGKDSTVLLHLVRSIYPDVVGVFIDTGLEYPEIKEFVKTTPNIVTIKPKLNFDKVIEKYGFPVVSKEVSHYINKVKAHGAPHMYRRHVEGLNADGSKCQFVIPKKWHFLLDAPFKISDVCCDKLKKQPIHTYEKETGARPFMGMMAGESRIRSKNYLEHGCNYYGTTKQNSSPLSFWTEEDIWEYLRTKEIPYSKIYDMGETRTGCMFCPFGVQREETPNRFQRMAVTHPKHYKYCMEVLGLDKVLGFIGVEFRPLYVGVDFAKEEEVFQLERKGKDY